MKPFFEINGIKDIAIYGLGELGDLFYNEITQYKINVKYFIDRDLSRFHGQKVYSPSYLEKISDVDLIIICISKQRGVERNVELLDWLKIKAVVPYCTISDIIDSCYYTQMIVPYLKEIECTTYFFTYPFLTSLHNLSEVEKVLSQLKYDDEIHKNNPRYFEEVYKGISEYNDDFIKKVFTVAPVVNLDGVFKLIDVKNNYVNSVGGKRLTTDVPDEFDNTIHICGGCTVYGMGVDDSRTISSVLQRKLNIEACKQYRVENYGWLNNRIPNSIEIGDKVRNIKFKKDDILIIIPIFNYSSVYNKSVFQYFANIFQFVGSEIHHLIEEFETEHKEQLLYYNRDHLSHRGIEVFAQYIKYVIIND